LCKFYANFTPLGNICLILLEVRRNKLYCSKCDKNFPKAQFCPDCGTTLLAAPVPPASVTIPSIKPKKPNHQAFIIGGSVFVALILILVGVKVSTDAAANDAKDKKISVALDSCSLTYGTGVDALQNRHAILTDDDYTSLSYSDLACVITALGGPSSSTAYDLVKTNYSTHDYIYGDVKIELVYDTYSADTLEIWVQ